MKQCQIRPNEYFHLSRTFLGDTPGLRGHRGRCGDAVCLCPTLAGCLEAVPFYHTATVNWPRRRGYVREGRVWHVYTPSQAYMGFVPKHCEDLERTHERRVQGEVEAWYVGKISVSCNRDRWEFVWRVGPDWAWTDEGGRWVMGG